MPNPLGGNDVFVPEPGYGELSKLDQLTKTAPMSGAPFSPIEAPRRAKRRATTTGRREEPVLPPPPLEITPEASAAAFWQTLAALPGASPLVRELANEATGA